MTRFMPLLKPMRFLTLPALLFTCALALGPAAHAQTAGADELRYTVKPGDTLEAVSRRLMEQPRRYPEIARLNGLRDQDALTPGQVLRFPAPYLKMQPVEGTITAVKGTATLNGAPAALDARVASQALVTTGADGQVTIRLADGSELRLQSGSALKLTEIKANPSSGARSTRLNLQKGRVETEVTPGKGDNSRFEIETPVAVTGVRGTSFRIAAYEKNANTEVLTGAVQTATTLGDVAVRQGFGTRADQGRPPARPVPLLPAPGLANLPALVESPDALLDFGAVSGARNYRALAATDEKFERIVAEAVNAAPSLRTAGLPDGEYFFRARAIDAAGLEGLNAAGRFRVKANPRPPAVTEPAPGGVPTPDGRMDLNFTWEAVADARGGYLLQIASDPAFTRDLTEQKAATNRLTLGFAVAPLRTVYWRVRSVDAAGSPGPFGPAQAFVMGRSN